MPLLKIFGEAVAKRSAEWIVGSYFATWLVTVTLTWLWGYNITINVPLLGMSFLSLLIASVASLIKHRKKPQWMKYTDDQFGGVRWRWQYDTKGAVQSLTARCPACKDEIDLHECFGQDGIMFFCGNCVCCHHSDITALRKEHVDAHVLKRINENLYDIRRGAIPIPGFPK